MKGIAIKAGEYDYLNARIRGMSRILLDNDTIDQLLKAEGEQLIIDVLMNSVYSTYLSEALVSKGGITAAETALRRNLFETVKTVLSLAPPGPRRILRIQMNRWDLINIITILRGKTAKMPGPEIQSAMMPAGEFHPVQLADLAAEPDIISVANALTTWGYDYGSILRIAINEYNESLTALESILHINYFNWAFSQLDPRDKQERILIDSLRIQIDLSNIISLLRLIDYRTRESGIPEINLIPNGSLSIKAVHELQNAKDLDEALETLEKTLFAPAVEKGILSFGRSSQLGSFERFLEAVVLEKGMKMFRADPLSVAVPLGFIWRKICEYQNIRMIIRGKKYKFPPNSIREALILV